MIYREMPAIWDRNFRQAFYMRWGRESAVISAKATRVEYPAYRQLLSIKTASGGQEDYFIDGRQVSVDDQTFFIINENRSYASRIESLTPVHSFSMFFDPSLVAQVCASLRNDQQAMLDDPNRTSREKVEFAERLYEHDRMVTPVLRHIQNTVDAGMNDNLWLDENVIVLLERMIRLNWRTRRQELLVPARKPSTRKELLRRLSLGVDFIHTRYRDALTLKAIASAAHLSPFYFLHVFKAVYRTTPASYVHRRRCTAAIKLLQQTEWNMTTIAEHVGFGSRSSLFRHLKRECGLVPRDLRPDQRQRGGDSALNPVIARH